MRVGKFLAGVSLLVAAGLLAPTRAFAADQVIPNSDLPKWPQPVQVPCGVIPPVPETPAVPDSAAGKYEIQVWGVGQPMTIPTMYDLYSVYDYYKISLTVRLSANDGYVFENGEKTIDKKLGSAATRCDIPRIEVAYLNVGDDVKSYNFAQHVLGEGERKVITHSVETYFTPDGKNVVELPDTSKPGRYRVWLRANYADGGTDKVVVPVIVTEKGQKPGPFWPDVQANWGVHSIHLANQGGKAPKGISLAPTDGIKASIVDGDAIKISGMDRSGSIDVKNVDGQVIDTIVVDVSLERDDSDGDGIIDRADKCAQTPKSATVDVSGCPVFSPTATPTPDSQVSTPGGLGTDGGSAANSAQPHQSAQVASVKPVPATETTLAVPKPGVPATGGSGVGFILATAAAGGLAVGVSRFRNRETQ